LVSSVTCRGGIRMVKFRRSIKLVEALGIRIASLGFDNKLLDPDVVEDWGCDRLNLRAVRGRAGAAFWHALCRAVRRALEVVLNLSGVGRLNR
jgi:hypothetical protein